MYLVIGTRPDLAFTVSMLSTFNSNPSAHHMKLALQVLRYIQHSSSYVLRFNRKLEAQSTATMYSDASWGSNLDNFKSFSGYIMQVNEATVSWSSKRQSCVAKSTCEAEHIACSYALAHLMWIKQVITELSQFPLLSTSFTPTTF